MGRAFIYSRLVMSVSAGFEVSGSDSMLRGSLGNARARRGSCKLWNQHEHKQTSQFRNNDPYTFAYLFLQIGKLCPPNHKTANLRMAKAPYQLQAGI